MRLIACIAVFSLSLLPASGVSTAGPSVILNPSEDIAAIVASSPAGTSFILNAGTYRLAQIRPKDGDTFSGPGTGHAVLDGAQPVTFEPISGSSPQLWKTTIGQMPIDTGKCITGHPLCNYTRELFIDTGILMPVTSTSELSKSTWYYDKSSGTAVINFNPGSHWFQIGTSICAFCGYSSHVTIKNLTVERYAAPSLTGAIGNAGGGSYWSLSNIEGRYNHGAAIQVGPNSTIENSYIHHNGQKGLGAHGANIIVQNNELAYNGYDYYDYGWESGGGKFGGLDHAEILDNNSHDNNGAGFWDDGSSIDVHYKGNHVENNAGAGIQHEIGYSAVIEQNIIIRNGNPPRISMWNGQVSVQNSSHTTVQDNTIIVAANYGSGLVIVNQQRNGSGVYGAFVGAYNIIQNNDITYEGTDGAGGIMGIESTGVGNEIDHNTYHINPNLNKHHFEAFGVKTFQQFQAAGFDVQSKIVWVH